MSKVADEGNFPENRTLEQLDFWTWCRIRYGAPLKSWSGFWVAKLLVFAGWVIVDAVWQITDQAFTQPNVVAWILVVGLILADTISGLIRSVCKDGWSSVTSGGLVKTWIKWLEWTLGWGSAAALDILLPTQGELVWLAATLVAVPESVSVWENLRWNLSSLADRARSFLPVTQDDE